MNDRTDFERRLSSAFAAYADRAPVEVDAITLTSVVARRRVHRRWSLPGPVGVIGRPTARVGLLLIVLGLLVAFVVGAITVGAIWRQRTTLPSPASAVFSPTGELDTAEGHVAVRLLDGRVLIVGGWNGATDGSQAWLWDPSTGSFTRTGRMSTDRVFPIAALLPDGEVLVAGGAEIPVGGGSVTELSSAELFDPGTGTFHATGSMLYARGTCHCAGFELGARVNYMGVLRATATALADGRIFVIGGYPAPWTSPEIYDPRSGSFGPAGTMPTCDASRVAAAALRDGRVLVKCIDSAFLYDPRSDSFSPTGTPATDSVGVALVLPDGRVLFAGRGRVGSAGRPEVFDPSTGTFRALSDPTDPLPGGVTSGMGTGVALPDGRAVFIDGSSAWLFDPTTETFARLDGGPLRGRTSPTATVLADGRVLIVGPTDAGVAGPQELLDTGRQ